MTPDLINGLFELSAAAFLLLSVRRVLKDRAVKGVSPTATAFFFLWGVWNVYFYPSQGLTWSFAGGVAVVIVNLIYLVALVYFLKPRPPRYEDFQAWDPLPGDGLYHDLIGQSDLRHELGP